MLRMFAIVWEYGVPNERYENSAYLYFGNSVLVVNQLGWIAIAPAFPLRGGRVAETMNLNSLPISG